MSWRDAPTVVGVDQDIENHWSGFRPDEIERLVANNMNEKMDVYVSVDELYPVYDLVEEPSPLTISLAVSAERVQRWRAAIEAYYEVREEIEAQINKEKNHAE